MIIWPAPLVSTPAQQQGRSRAWAWCPRIAVAATVAWSFWELRAAVSSAQYLDDNSVHEQMVRFAAAQIRAGHDPLSSWFPYLGLGSPQFLHYQSTPAILTGLVGLLTGPDTAFRWSLYLLCCLWPVAIYGSARLLRLSRGAAAAAAVVSPLLHSAPGIGYEQHAYLWQGYGVWTQLWGSWALPFAWALTWRAASDRRFIAPAAALVALTCAFHFETGYLAFLGVLLAPFLIWRHIGARLARAAVLLVAALLASAWVVLPLLLYSRWAAGDQAQAGTPLEDGYGARTVLGWLVTGRMFDDGHLPVISLLVAAGLAAALLRWRQAGPGRMLLALLCGSLLLSFGRTTFGGLAGALPGGSDVFFRRFMMGAQLAGIYLAGLGAAEVARQGVRLGTRLAARLADRSERWRAERRPGWLAGRFTAGWPGWLGDRRPGERRPAWLAGLSVLALGLAGVAYLFPAWHYVASYDATNAADIYFQRLAQQDEPQVAAAAAFIRRHGDGRAYAGSTANWGQYFRVGFVPMYAYLESQDVDEVGYTLRTASLMTQPEYHFDAANPGDYAVFGIRYLTTPSPPAAAPPPGAVLVFHDSLLRIYELPGSSYLRVAATVGSVAASRADVGSQTAAYLRSALPGQDRYLTVGWSGQRAAAVTEPAAGDASAVRPGAAGPAAQPANDGPPGAVVSERADLAGGQVSGVVRLRRAGVAVLSASFDPGWQVTVDGRPARAQMVAPALVAVAVPPGTHRVAFRYAGFGWYGELLGLAVLVLLAVAALTRRHTLFSTWG